METVFRFELTWTSSKISDKYRKTVLNPSGLHIHGVLSKFLHFQKLDRRRDRGQVVPIELHI